MRHLKKQLQKNGFHIKKKSKRWIVQNSENTFCILMMHIPTHRQVLIQDGKWMWIKHLLRYGQIEGKLDNSKFTTFAKETLEMIKILCIKGKDVPLYIQTKGMHRRFVQLTDRINSVHIINEFELLSFLLYYPFDNKIEDIQLEF